MYATQDEWATLLPSPAVAMRFVSFFETQSRSLGTNMELNILNLVPCADSRKETGQTTASEKPLISAVFYPKEYSSIAKSFWQHSGEGISTRRAELCHQAFIDDFLIPSFNDERGRNGPGLTATNLSFKGPRRYRKGSVANGTVREVTSESVLDASVPKESSRNMDECAQFVEERYGRNLDFSLAPNAKLAIRKRIAGGLTTDINLEQTAEVTLSSASIRRVPGFSEDDVYLYPSGMSSIFNTHRIMMACKEKWGPGCQFYGNGSAEDLDDLEKRCARGERFLALFCEFPGNPLLKCPDLRRIRALADRFDFAVVVDETIGNFLNIHVLPHADIIVSSLTKVFSGDSNVMGGSSILNPSGRFYKRLKEIMGLEYEDNYWAEDALFMERNSRDFIARIARMNRNAEAICDCLKASRYVKDVYYPKYSSTRSFYDQYRTPAGGYGGLLSVTFRTRLEAIAFYDALETAKGPSLGTNFTLSCPYTLLAHYTELSWVSRWLMKCL
ncbi:MAG: hypothetical protein L6R35_001002 [Caloplaca aegaea]|nr:MAG: hypothetical protein L6R35_001002 [Caloplaca aegaea]